MKYRQESDSMGPMDVPQDAYYGAQTQRAVENFPISELRFTRPFIKAMGLIKKNCAVVNLELGLLDKGIARQIGQAADEVIAGNLDDQFVVDIFQTGSGTSTNMNANEVIASRANELLGGRRGGRSPVHPNDHVNLGQSSNDVIPSAIHLAAYLEIFDSLIPAATDLNNTLVDKAAEFKDIRKIGRTHLQDAVPMTLGQEFSGYAAQVDLAINNLISAAESLRSLALGGTAVGNGINSHRKFAQGVIALISIETGYKFYEAENHFAAQAAQDGAVAASSSLKGLAVSLVKIANDIRWLASGPRCGIGEIIIPALQPGSSIMPGKVNPVIPEAVLQVAAQVIGNDTAITFAAQSGVFELNVMLPVLAHNLLQSIALLSSVILALDEKCLRGVKADAARCNGNLEKSLALATAFVPEIGYDLAAAIAKEAHESGRSIREVAVERKILPADDINRILDAMIKGE